jgi:hypothetical protein
MSFGALLFQETFSRERVRFQLSLTVHLIRRRISVTPPQKIEESSIFILGFKDSKEQMSKY